MKRILYILILLIGQFSFSMVPRNIKQENIVEDPFWKMQEKYLVEPAKYYGEMPEELNLAVLMEQNKKEFEKVGLSKSSNYIFHGPPGVGKTFVGSIFAQKIGAQFMYVRGTDLMSGLQAGGLTKPEELFEKARDRRDKLKKPVVMFIDEIDTVVFSRKNDKMQAANLNLLGSLLKEIGSDTNNNIIIVAATNYLKNIDESLLRSGRFDHHIQFTLPSVEHIQQFCIFLTKEYDFFDTTIDWSVIASMLKGVNYADINKMINAFKRTYVLRKIDKNKELIKFTQSHFEGYINRHIKSLISSDAELDDEQFWRAQEKYLVDPAKYYGQLPEELSLAVYREQHKKDFEDVGLYKKANYIFHGPPGVGKTFVGSIFAQKIDAQFMYVRGGDLMDKWQASGLTKPEELFEKARARRDKLKKPILMFIDEIDTIVSSRDKAYVHQGDMQLLGSLLKEIGSDVNNDIIVVAATNCLKNIDEALLRSGRFDHHIAFELPLVKDIENFCLFLTKRYSFFDVNINWSKVALRLKGLNYADVNKMIDVLKQAYVLKKIKSGMGAVQITQEDVMNYIDSCKEVAKANAVAKANKAYFDKNIREKTQAQEVQPKQNIAPAVKEYRLEQPNVSCNLDMASGKGDFLEQLGSFVPKDWVKLTTVAATSALLSGLSVYNFCV